MNSRQGEGKGIGIGLGLCIYILVVACAPSSRMSDRNSLFGGAMLGNMHVRNMVVYIEFRYGGSLELVNAIF